MKDYSMSKEERKAFILGYDITEDGNIVVKKAEGEPWILPYNETNEKILLAKMTTQVKEAYDFEESAKNKNIINKRIAVACCIVSVLLSAFGILGTGNLSLISLLITPIIASAGLGLSFNIVNNNLVLKDLKRNKEFLAMQETLNANIRGENNVLANVSNKTKKAVEDFPEDKPIFTINSFNYVPFRDLEQIRENVALNDLFGFNYSEQKGKTKKRIRK